MWPPVVGSHGVAQRSPVALAADSSFAPSLDLPAGVAYMQAQRTHQLMVVQGEGMGGGRYGAAFFKASVQLFMCARQNIN